MTDAIPVLNAGSSSLKFPVCIEHPFPCAATGAAWPGRGHPDTAGIVCARRARRGSCA